MANLGHSIWRRERKPIPVPDTAREDTETGPGSLCLGLFFVCLFAWLLFFLRFLFLYICMFGISVWVQLPVEARGELETVELELQVVVSCLMKLLGTEFRSSGKAVSAHNL